MPADRLLITLLRALQTPSNSQETPRLLATASSLFATLSNPKNLALLTAQLLSAPAIWAQPTSLKTCLSVVGTYESAALSILRREVEVAGDLKRGTGSPGQTTTGQNQLLNKWLTAISSGADDRSPTWRHALVFAGLLLGFEGQGRKALPGHARRGVAGALVKAVNVALEDVRLGGEEEAAHAVALALNYTFDLLDESEKASIDYDWLLPALVGSSFFSKEGFRSGYFFASVDADIVQVNDNMFTWSPRSPSFVQISELASQPLIITMGPLSKLIGQAVENLKDPFLVQTLVDDLVEFSQTILTQWRQIKLSEVDAREEARYLDETAMDQTIPVLWRLLRSSMFAVAIILSSVTSRVLRDRSLAGDQLVPALAVQILSSLRHLYFISSRLGSNALSQHTFVYLTAIDMLSAFPSAADTFIRDIRPAILGQIPPNPLDRSLDLFFLNTAEHFTLTLPVETNENILIAATIPYLIAGGDVNLIDSFEAAHSVTLAVFSSPQNKCFAASHVPFYVDVLFKAFPHNLSGRQFRLAFKTLVRITTPPSALSTTHPELPEILLELVHHRLLQPPSEPRLALYTASQATDLVQRTLQNSATGVPGPGTKDDTAVVLVSTLIDSLPHLPQPLLEEWLPRLAALIPKLDSHKDRETCRQRFWQIISDGEMDVERSQVCVAWWATNGGREMVMHDTVDENFVMSGALDGSHL